MEAKSFQLRFEINGGVRLAERSRLLFRVVVLGFAERVLVDEIVGGVDQRR